MNAPLCKWEDQYAQAWTTRRPALIEMTDAEMFAWLAEYCDMLVYKRPTPEYGGSYIVYCDEIRTVAPTFPAELENLRMAPKKVTVRYRLCAFRNSDGTLRPGVTDSESRSDWFENRDEDFVCWLTDWQEVEIPQ